jgi:hypothetical protein
MGTALFPQQEQNAGEIVQGTRKFLDQQMLLACLDKIVQ